jgi:hypothetical protein
MAPRRSRRRGGWRTRAPSSRRTSACTRARRVPHEHLRPRHLADGDAGLDRQGVRRLQAEAPERRARHARRRRADGICRCSPIARRRSSSARPSSPGGATCSAPAARDADVRGARDGADRSARQRQGAVDGEEVPHRALPPVHEAGRKERTEPAARRGRPPATASRCRARFRTTSSRRSSTRCRIAGTRRSSIQRPRPASTRRPLRRRRTAAQSPARLRPQRDDGPQDGRRGGDRFDAAAIGKTVLRVMAYTGLPPEQIRALDLARHINFHEPSVIGHARKKGGGTRQVRLPLVRGRRRRAEGVRRARYAPRQGWQADPSRPHVLHLERQRDVQPRHRSTLRPARGRPGDATGRRAAPRRAGRRHGLLAAAQLPDRVAAGDREHQRDAELGDAQRRADDAPLSARRGRAGTAACGRTTRCPVGRATKRQRVDGRGVEECRKWAQKRDAENTAGSGKFRKEKAECQRK